MFKIVGIKWKNLQFNWGPQNDPNYNHIFIYISTKKKSPKKLNEPKVVISNQITQRYPNNKKVRKSNIQKHLCFCHRPVTARFLFIISCVCFVSKLFNKKNFEAFEEGKSRNVRKICWQCKAPRAVANFIDATKRKTWKETFAFRFPILFFNSEICKMLWMLDHLNHWIVNCQNSKAFDELSSQSFEEN